MTVQATAYIGAETSLDSATDPAANVILLPGDDNGVAAAAGAGSGKGSTGGSGDAPVLPVVPFDACLSKFAAAEVIGLPACRAGWACGQVLVQGWQFVAVLSPCLFTASQMG